LLSVGLLIPALYAGAQPAAESDPALIEIDPLLDGRLRTAEVRSALLRRTLRIPATVELDPSRVSRIDAGVEGRVVEVLVADGQRVSAGQVLARITSPELTRAQVALLGARADVSLQRRAVARASELVEAEVIAQAELERRQNDLFMAATSVQSHRDQLTLMGMSEAEIRDVERTESIRPQVGIVSRRDGVVIERAVDRGQVVSVGEPLFTVADLTRVQVEGRVPEREVAFVARAEGVQVEIPAAGRSATAGEEFYVAPTVDPTTRTVTVRTFVDSPEGTIKPNMLATLVLLGRRVEQLAVPAQAVVRDGDDEHVFVREGEGRYRFAAIAAEREIDGLRAVAEGLSEGDVVVVDGAFRLNAERKRRLGR
jgi:cobalt-zinc-cadmium efflux system membrane fusion protein